MRKILKIVIQFIVFVFLTVLTQVGGIVYLLVIVLVNKLRITRIKSVGLFIGLYLLTTVIIVPLVAPFFGRTSLPITGQLRPLNILTCLLNRQYVRPELKQQLISASKEMNKRYGNTKTNYLDANFPFFNHFPLFPHLSHSDGKKIDLAFYYIDSRNDQPSDSAPSFIGYGIYDAPFDKEINYPEKCKEQGYFQYGFLTHLIPKWNEDKYEVDSERTAELISILSGDELTSKIFIEPHLKQRWNLAEYEKIRFHGCQAVRHDDHIHSQIK